MHHLQNGVQHSVWKQPLEQEIFYVCLLKLKSTSPSICKHRNRICTL